MRIRLALSTALMLAGALAAISSAAAAKNPLLGTWSVDGPPGAQPMMAAMCRKFGEVQFREKTMRVRAKANIEVRPGDATVLQNAAILEQLLGAMAGADPTKISGETITRVTYTFEDDVWFVKPAGSEDELTIVVRGPNELRMTDLDCVMTRITESAASAAPGSTPQGGQAPAAGQVAAISPAPAAGGAVEVLGLTLGSSTLDEVRDRLAKRGMQIVSEKTFPNAVALRARGGSTDSGLQLVSEVAFGFHRSSGLLTGVNLVVAGSEGPDALFQKRVAELASKYQGTKEGDNSMKFQASNASIQLTKHAKGVWEVYMFTGQLP